MSSSLGRWSAVLVAALAGCSSASGEAPGGDAGAARDAGSRPGDATADRVSPPPHDATRDAAADAASAPCPEGMVFITGLVAGTPDYEFCIDRYEAYVVNIGPDGGESPHSPYDVIGGASVRARSAPGVVPQGYISQLEAAAACAAAGKQLCSADEFVLACRGPDAGSYFPYGGETRVPGDCNEGKGSEMVVLFGDNAADWTFANFNDPRLNQIDGGLARTGAYPKCVSPFGVHDCVGNLDEWGSDPPDDAGHGRFRGGYYGDAMENGPGCLYVTSAHDVSYHDYSTGFRCCWVEHPQ